MALNNTYFESNKIYEPLPIPDQPGYVPPTPPTPPTPGSGDVPVIPRPSFSGTITVTFYDNSSDNNVLNKSISSVTSKSISIKEDCNLLRPEIYINGVINCNYMQMLDRYYYIECTALPGNITKITGKVDVLMTYKDQIKAQSAIIERNSNNVNTYLPDPERKITAYKTSHAVKFSSGFSKTLNYYLLTTGN